MGVPRVTHCAAHLLGLSSPCLSQDGSGVISGDGAAALTSTAPRAPQARPGFPIARALGQGINNAYIVPRREATAALLSSAWGSVRYNPTVKDTIYRVARWSNPRLKSMSPRAGSFMANAVVGGRVNRGIDFVRGRALDD